MSKVITPDYLRDSAVEAVRAYVTSQTPLTDSVVAIAKRDSLSPEQIARIIEVTNQVAYLKLLEGAQDRTFEFELANKDDVMEKLMSTPSESLSKSASLSSPLDAFKEELTKSASEDESREITPMERHTLILKEYQRSLGQLEKLASQERELIFSLSAQLQICRKDEEILEKVAYLTDGSEDAIKDVSKMIYGHHKEASCEQMFYEEDLKDTRRLVDLVAKAHDVLEKKAVLQESVDKAGAYLKHVAKTGVMEAKNTVDRAKDAMPGRLTVLMMAPAFHPTTPVSSLHKTMPN